MGQKMLCYIHNAPLSAMVQRSSLKKVKKKNLEECIYLKIYTWRTKEGLVRSQMDGVAPVQAASTSPLYQRVQNIHQLPFAGKALLHLNTFPFLSNKIFIIMMSLGFVLVQIFFFRFASSLDPTHFLAAKTLLFRLFISGSRQIQHLQYRRFPGVS